MTAKMMTKSKRQIAFVTDMNKCIGCQNCTVACKRLWSRNPGQDYMYWRNVETAPGMGYPKNWAKKGGGYMDGKLQKGKRPSLQDYGVPFEFDYEDRLFNGVKGRVKPSPAPRWAPNWEDDQGAGDYPNNHFFYMPRMCNHCDSPACAEACPNDAIYKREADGLTVINLEHCKGKKDCIDACPYAKPYYNSTSVKSNKCIGCFPRVEKGIAPACVSQCSGRAMHVGYLDDAKSSVNKLVKAWKVALPLYGKHGTQPNVFYVPPFLGPSTENDLGNIGSEPKIPQALLEEMFGSEVIGVLAVLRKERKNKMMNKSSELMDILVGRRSADMMFDTMP